MFKLLTYLSISSLFILLNPDGICDVPFTLENGCGNWPPNSDFTNLSWNLSLGKKKLLGNLYHSLPTHILIGLSPSNLCNSLEDKCLYTSEAVP